MQIITTIAETKKICRTWQKQGLTIGLVPTMGYLHEGHISLMRSARTETDRVVATIFVNPTQFGPNEDFERYPRNFESDAAMAKEAGVDILFCPEVAEMYPPGYISYVEPAGLTDMLCGASRPGHFRGVATVVLKLFEIVRPDVAVFGQKDYQQQLVIRRMVQDLHVPVRIVTEPTVREPDGLAMSSRNRYLDPDERRAALVLYRALARAREAVLGGESSANRVRQILGETIESNERVHLDYAEVADADTLEPLDRLGPGIRAVALVAARVGSTRLIDNLALTE